jgi:hypothetical protein
MRFTNGLGIGLKMDMRFGTRSVRSLYATGSLKKKKKETVASELAKFKLDLVAVQKVKWENGGSQAADNYTFSYGKGLHEIS